MRNARGVPNVQRVSQKSFRFSEATCQNLHFQHIAGARLCGSENLLPAYWFGLGRKKAICTVVCAQGHAMQLSVLVASAAGCVPGKCSRKWQWKTMQLTGTEHVSQQKFWSSGCA